MWKEVKETFKLGWPIIIGNVSQMALGIIDTAMVGAISSQQVAAASFVTNLVTIPQVFAIGISTAISTLVAEAHGSDDKNTPLRIMFNGSFVVFLYSLLLAVLFHTNLPLIQQMGQDEIVVILSKPYLIWMAWGMIPMALFIALKQYTDGLGFTRWAMYLSVAVMPLNVLLNYLFIYGKWGFPRLELEGAGLATFLSRIIVLLVLLWIVFRDPAMAIYRRRVRVQCRLHVPSMKKVLGIGIPAGFQYGMEAGAFSVSGIMVGWLGYVQQAAHQIVLGIASLTFMVALGLSMAGSIRVGYAFGQRNLPLARTIGLSTLITAACFGLCCGIIFVLTRYQLPTLFNREADVLYYTALLMVLAGLFQLSDSIQAVGVGLLRGLQDVKWPTLFVAIAYWVIGIPLGYVLAFGFGWQVQGIWVGFIAGLSVSAILLSWRFYRLSRKPG